MSFYNLKLEANEKRQYLRIRSSPAANPQRQQLHAVAAPQWQQVFQRGQAGNSGRVPASVAKGKGQADLGKVQRKGAGVRTGELLGLRRAQTVLPAGGVGAAMRYCWLINQLNRISHIIQSPHDIGLISTIFATKQLSFLHYELKLINFDANSSREEWSEQEVQSLLDLIRRNSS